MKPSSDVLVDQLVENTRNLLNQNIARAETVFAATNIKLTIAHLIDFSKAEPKTKSTISFGARVHDTIEVTIADPNQTELPINAGGHDGQENGDGPNARGF